MFDIISIVAIHLTANRSTYLAADFLLIGVKNGSNMHWSSLGRNANEFDSEEAAVDFIERIAHDSINNEYELKTLYRKVR